MTTATLTLLLAAAAWPASGITTYSQPLTAVTSLSVTEASHGINSPYIGVTCRDSFGNKLTLDQVSWTVNPSTYEVDLTFASTFTGTVKLSGPWPTSDTSNATDFQVTIGSSDNSKLLVCSQCATYTARRTYNAQAFTANAGAYLEWVSFTAPTVYVYFRENVLTYGLNQSGCAIGSYSVSSYVAVECNVNGMPGGVVPLASASISAGVFTGVTDLRPW